MSLRRRSCDPCFGSRRKCDWAFPICSRCRRNNKVCHYAYPPPLPDKETAEPALAPGDDACNQQRDDAASTAENGNVLMARGKDIPRALGQLGIPPRITGTESHMWVFTQIRDCPRLFATRAETFFIHPALYQGIFPPSIRTAFGICAAATLSPNQQIRPLIFRAVEAEASSLLHPSQTKPLLEDLARFQALVLYQIIKVFYGGREEQRAAEEQEFMVRSTGLRLLQRAEAELPASPSTWGDWVFAESVRRTVLLSFKLYTLYWSFRAGCCKEYGALNLLPLSATPDLWERQDADMECPEVGDAIMTHGQLLSQWDADPQRKLNRFEKFLVVAWNGAPTWEALTKSPVDVE